MGRRVLLFLSENRLEKLDQLTKNKKDFWLLPIIKCATGRVQTTKSADFTALDRNRNFSSLDSRSTQEKLESKRKKRRSF